MNEELFLEILDSREERSKKQEKIIKEYNNTLISYTINSPGQYKDTDIYKAIHKEGYKSIISLLEKENIEVLHKEYITKRSGPEAYIIVGYDAKEIKKLMVKLEKEHFLGRIFDIDIFDKNKNQIGRSELNLEARKCLICDKEVRLCMREKNHTYEELIDFIEYKWKEFNK